MITCLMHMCLHPYAIISKPYMFIPIVNRHANLRVKLMKSGDSEDWESSPAPLRVDHVFEAGEMDSAAEDFDDGSNDGPSVGLSVSSSMHSDSYYCSEFEDLPCPEDEVLSSRKRNRSSVNSSNSSSSSSSGSNRRSSISSSVNSSSSSSSSNRRSSISSSSSSSSSSDTSISTSSKECANVTPVKKTVGSSSSKKKGHSTSDRSCKQNGVSGKKQKLVVGSLSEDQGEYEHKHWIGKEVFIYPRAWVEGVACDDMYKEIGRGVLKTYCHRDFPLLKKCKYDNEVRRLWKVCNIRCAYDGPPSQKNRPLVDADVEERTIFTQRGDWKKGGSWSDYFNVYQGRKDSYMWIWEDNLSPV